MSKSNPELYWFLSDKWFRIIEFSLILGLFHYFSIETDYLTLKIVYWLSWYVVFMWFLELIDYLFEEFVDIMTTRGKKLLVYIVTIVVVSAFYALIVTTTQIVIEKQFEVPMKGTPISNT
jgi:hypothetical protein